MEGENVMNILMLGHSGVGKTTYMASMYGMLQRPINGLSIKASNSDDHTRLMKLFESVERGYYPDPTEQRSEYDFSLRYQGRDVIPFRWVDYRGSVLLERSKTSLQAETFQKDLLHADGILVFCESPALKTGNPRKVGIARLMSMLSNALHAITHPVPLAIVLTKSDLADELEESDFAVLQGLIQAIQASEHIAGTLIPTACGCESSNIEIPVLFALYIGIARKIMQAKENAEQYAEERNRYLSKENIFDWIGSKWRGEFTYTDLARIKHQKALEEIRTLEELLEPAKNLETYLNDFMQF